MAVWDHFVGSILLSVVLASLTFCSAASALNVSVNIELDRVVNIVDERYLSVALEASIFKKHWGSFNTRSPKLQTLASALSPAYLRVGGSSCDFLHFDKAGKHKARKKGLQQNKIKYYFSDAGLGDEDFEGDVFLGHQMNYTNFTMTGHDWDSLNKFATRVDFRVMFDLNVFLRKNGAWDPSNAKELLEYSITRNYTRNLDLQLGNEPSAYHHAFNRTITADQLGRDMLTLVSMVRGEYQQYFTNSLLVGPDITRPKKRALKYLTEYLEVVNNSIDAVTWHHYYVDGRTATADDFLNPAVLDLLKPMLASVIEATNDTRQLWMGETSSAWGGGAKGLSNRYIAGFMWLDKLGLAAQNKQKVVTRQSLYGGHYALLDDELRPLPDYWLSVLFKRLVGRQVFMTTSEKDKVRLYAHCTAETRTRSGSFNAGSVTVFGLNVEKHDATITLPAELQQQTKKKYILTPKGRKNLTSKSVKLNGRKLKLLSDYLLPKMGGKKMAADEPIILPAESFGFFVIDAAVKICNQQV